jgi:hypothetical protein
MLGKKITQQLQDFNKKCFKGKQSIDYPLSFLPDKDYYILHDLRLQVSAHYFQIDSLVMSRNFIVILEVKNIAGTIYFDHVFHQLIRTQEGKETAFQDPITQSNRHELQLKKWLAKNRISEVPIISIVVISNSNTVIRSSSKNIDLNQKVIHANFLPTKIQQIEKKYPEKLLSEKEVKKVARLLVTANSPLDIPILKQYGIHEDELLKGVFCPSCQHLPMLRVYGKWFCMICKLKMRDAHIAALKDYVLLHGSEITNKKLRGFLNITSTKLATRLLQSMNLSGEGTTRDKIYYIPIEDSIDE